MDSKTFRALLGYKSVMAQARAIAEKHLITIDEYRIIEARMCEKYGINSDSLYRENDLIISATDGNMPAAKEVAQWQRA